MAVEGCNLHVANDGCRQRSLWVVRPGVAASEYIEDSVGFLRDWLSMEIVSYPLRMLRRKDKWNNATDYGTRARIGHDGQGARDGGNLSD